MVKSKGYFFSLDVLIAVIGILGIVSIFSIYMFQAKNPSDQIVLIAKDLTRVLSTVRVNDLNFHDYVYRDTLFIGVVNSTPEYPVLLEILVGKTQNVTVIQATGPLDLEHTTNQLLVGEKKVWVFNDTTCADPAKHRIKFLISPAEFEDIAAGGDVDWACNDASGDGLPYLDEEDYAEGFRNVLRAPSLYLPVTVSNGIMLRRMENAVIYGTSSLRLELVNGDYLLMNASLTNTSSAIIGGADLTYNVMDNAKYGWLQISQILGGYYIPFAQSPNKFYYNGGVYSDIPYAGILRADNFWEIQSSDPTSYGLYFRNFSFDIESELLHIGQYRDEASLLELLGVLYSVGEREFARQLAEQILGPLVPPQFGFQMLLGGEEITVREKEPTRNLYSMHHMITGLQAQEDALGASATIFLRDLSEADLKYIYYGGYVGDGRIQKVLDMPAPYVGQQLASAVYVEVDAGNNFLLNVSNTNGNTVLLDYRKPTANLSYVMRHLIVQFPDYRELFVVNVTPIGYPSLSCIVSYLEGGVPVPGSVPCIDILVGDIYHEQLLGDTWMAPDGYDIKVESVVGQPNVVKFTKDPGSEWILLREGEWGTFATGGIGVYLRQYNTYDSKVNYLYGQTIRRKMRIQNKDQASDPTIYLPSADIDAYSYLQLQTVEPAVYDPDKIATAHLSLSSIPITVYPNQLVTLVDGSWPDYDGLDEGRYNLSAIHQGLNLLTMDFSRSPNFFGTLSKRQFVGGGYIRVSYDTPEIMYGSASRNITERHYLSGVMGDGDPPYQPTLGGVSPALNLFSSFDVLGQLSGINVHFEYNRRAQDQGNLFFTIGDSVIYTSIGEAGQLRFPGTNTLYSGNGTEVVVDKSPSDDWEYVIVDLHLRNHTVSETHNPGVPSGSVQYNNMSFGTIPYRLGFREVRKTDIALVTDLSGSMSECLSEPINVHRDFYFQGASTEDSEFERSLFRFSSTWADFAGDKGTWVIGNNNITYREPNNIPGKSVFWYPKFSTLSEWTGDTLLEHDAYINATRTQDLEYGIAIRHVNSSISDRRYYLLKYVADSGTARITFSRVSESAGDRTETQLVFDDDQSYISFPHVDGNYHFLLSANYESIYFNITKPDGSYVEASVSDDLYPDGLIGFVANTTNARQFVTVYNFSLREKRDRIVPEEHCGATLFYDNFNLEAIDKDLNSFGKWDPSPSSWRYWSAAGLQGPSASPLGIPVKMAVVNRSGSILKLPAGDESNWRNYTLSYNLRIEVIDTWQSMNVYLRYLGNNDYYQLQFSEAPLSKQPIITALKVRIGVPTILGSYTYKSEPAIKNGIYRISVQGSDTATIEVFGPDDTFIGRFKDISNPIPYGKIAFQPGAQVGKGFALDNIMVVQGSGSTTTSALCHDLGYCQVSYDSTIPGINYTLNKHPEPITPTTCLLQNVPAQWGPVTCEGAFPQTGHVNSSVWCVPGTSGGTCNSYTGSPKYCGGYWARYYNTTYDIPACCLTSPPLCFKPACGAAPPANGDYLIEQTQNYYLPQQCNASNKVTLNLNSCRTNYGTLMYEAGPCPAGTETILIHYEPVYTSTPSDVPSPETLCEQENNQEVKKFSKAGVMIDGKDLSVIRMYERDLMATSTPSRMNSFYVAKRFCQDFDNYPNIPTVGDWRHTICSSSTTPCRYSEIAECAHIFKYYTPRTDFDQPEYGWTDLARYYNLSALAPRDCNIMNPLIENVFCDLEGSVGYLYTSGSLSNATDRVTIDYSAGKTTNYPSFRSLIADQCVNPTQIHDLPAPGYDGAHMIQKAITICDNSDPLRPCGNTSIHSCVVIPRVRVLNAGSELWDDNDPVLLGTLLPDARIFVVRADADHVRVFNLSHHINLPEPVQNGYFIITGDDDAQMTAYQFEDECRNLNLGSDLGVDDFSNFTSLGVPNFNGVKKICDNSYGTECSGSNPDGNCKCYSPLVRKCYAEFHPMTDGYAVSELYGSTGYLHTCDGIEDHPYIKSFNGSSTLRFHCECFEGDSEQECYLFEIRATDQSTDAKPISGFSRTMTGSRHRYRQYYMSARGNYNYQRTSSAGSPTQDYQRCSFVDSAFSRCTTNLTSVQLDDGWIPKPAGADFNWDGDSSYGSIFYYHNFTLPPGVDPLDVQELTVEANHNRGIWCRINNIPFLENSASARSIRALVVNRSNAPDATSESDLRALNLVGYGSNNTIICQVRVMDATDDELFDLSLKVQYYQGGVLQSSRTIIPLGDAAWLKHPQSLYCGGFASDSHFPDCEYGQITDSCEGVYPYTLPEVNHSYLFFSGGYTYYLDKSTSRLASNLDDVQAGRNLRHANGTLIPQRVNWDFEDYDVCNDPDPFELGWKPVPSVFWNVSFTQRILLLTDIVSYWPSCEGSMAYLNEVIATALISSKTLLWSTSALFFSDPSLHFIDPRLNNELDNQYELSYSPQYSGATGDPKRVRYHLLTKDSVGYINDSLPLYYGDYFPGLQIDDTSSHSAERASELLLSLYPVFNYSDPSGSCQQNYCIPPIGSAECQICPAIKVKLARMLDRQFVESMYDKQAGSIILVDYGSSANGFCDLDPGDPDNFCGDPSPPNFVNETNRSKYYSLYEPATAEANLAKLDEAISEYSPRITGMSTCISCAVRKAVNALLYDVYNPLNPAATEDGFVEFAQTDVRGVHDKAVLLMTDGIANTCWRRDGTCYYGYSMLHDVENRELIDFYLNVDWYSLDQGNLPGMQSDLHWENTTLRRECKMSAGVWGCYEIVNGCYSVAEGGPYDTCELYDHEYSSLCVDDSATPLYNEISECDPANGVADGFVTFLDCDPANPDCKYKREAIYEACYEGQHKARNQSLRLTFYTIDFGIGANDPERALKTIAECSNGVYFKGDNTDELQSIYSLVANEILFSSQSIEGVSVPSTLMNNSYIEYSYQPTSYIDTAFGDVVITRETDSFKKSDFRSSTGAHYAESMFQWPAHVRLQNVELLSYSSSNWTAETWVYAPSNPDYASAQNVFNVSTFLTEEQGTFLTVGDPFKLRLPLRSATGSFFSHGNNTIYLAVQSAPLDLPNFPSLSSKIIYTMLLSTVTASPSFAPRSLGCYWQIQFQTGITQVWPFPANPPPSSVDICNYRTIYLCYDADSLDIDTSFAPWVNQSEYCKEEAKIDITVGFPTHLPIIITQDAVNGATYAFLKKLDLNSESERDGVIGIPFDLSDVVLQVNSRNIPYIIGPVEMELRVWN